MHRKPKVIKGLICILIIVIYFLITGCQKTVTVIPPKAVVQFIVGDVTIDNQPAAIGQVVNNNAIITTGASSMVEVRLGKHSGTQIRENSKARISNSASGWAVKSYQGAALNIIQPGNHYRFNGPSSVIAVRGTIFYVHSYEDSTQYICTCNGSIDIKDGQHINKTVSAPHHEGYTATESASGQTFEPTEMKEHNDVEIFEFMYRIEHGSGTE